MSTDLLVRAPRANLRTRTRVRARVRRGRGVLVASAIVVGVVMVPLAFLFLEADGAGVASIWHMVWRPLTATLLWNTVRLTFVVTVLSACIGTAAAWFVERTDLPGRHVWAVLVVIPFAIPDFVIAFGWSSLFTWVHGFTGAIVVMTLGVYPLVYLPVAASLRSADPGVEEAARSLGLSRRATFVRVTLSQVRGALLGGCVLVALVILAEYGAFEILGYQTFTTEIYEEFNALFNVSAACALSLVLIILGALVVLGDYVVRHRGPTVRTGSFSQRATHRRALGRWKWPTVGGFVVLTGVALGVPVGSSVYWILEGPPQQFSGASLWVAGGYTALYGGCAAALATVMALPVAILAVRHDSRVALLFERSSFIVMAMPGIVIAFALSYFSVEYADGFANQSAAMLIVAYAILFFPLALVGVRASVAFAPVRLDEAAQSLGVSRIATLRRVTLPLVGPGLGAAFCLVFLAAITELTATLLLIPLNTETLATQFWSYETSLSYGQAAPFALVMIALAAVPSYVLARFFDRLPARAARAA